MRFKLILIISLLAASISNAEAKIEGVSYTEIQVGGRVYEIPLGNKSFEQDIYWVKKAIKGDEEAREILLGGQDKRQIYIGDDTGVRWLTITKTSEYVTEI